MNAQGGSDAWKGAGATGPRPAGWPSDRAETMAVWPTAATEVLDVARQVAAIVRRVIAGPRCRVVLFGSWATGRARERSDIDIGLLGPAEIPATAMAEIRDACEALPTLHTIDLVDLAAAGPDLRRVATAHGIDVRPD